MSSIGMTHGPLFGGAAFTGNCCFLNSDPGFLWSLGCGTVVCVYTRSPLIVRLVVLLFVARVKCLLVVRIFSHGGERSASSATNCSKLSS